MQRVYHRRRCSESLFLDFVQTPRRLLATRLAMEGYAPILQPFSFSPLRLPLIHFSNDRMFIDEELPKHKQPEPFPRKLEGMAVEHMREYITALEEEIAKVKTEIEKRGGVKAKAEALFK